MSDCVSNIFAALLVSLTEHIRSEKNGLFCIVKSWIKLTKFMDLVKKSNWKYGTNKKKKTIILSVLWRSLDRI